MLKDIKYRKFGKLFAIRKVGKNRFGHSIWLCDCDCGGRTRTLSSSLIRGYTRSCGCLRKGRKYLPDGEAAFNILLRKYKASASDRGYSFRLSRQSFKKLTLSGCFYCGMEPNQTVKVSNRHNLNKNYIHNGLDRVNNSKGYSIQNCVPCCSSCNYSKRDLSQKEFLSKVSKICNHLNL